MAPVPRPGWDPEAEAPEGRPAAVLVLLHPGPDSPTGPAALILTERTETVDRHRSQISFPGGRIDPGESVEQAALRETLEEVGVAVHLPRVLGRLTPLWVPATGFTIHPVVAVLDAPPGLAPSPREVRRIFEPSLDRLLDPARVRVEPSMMKGRWVRVPFFDLDGARLWGASAMITAELLALLGWTGPQAS
jgi:8-oxo-dGTP pyrophosphatase MutT (NUDIX family)